MFVNGTLEAVSFLKVPCFLHNESIHHLEIYLAHKTKHRFYKTFNISPTLPPSTAYCMLQYYIASIFSNQFSPFSPSNNRLRQELLAPASPHASDITYSNFRPSLLPPLSNFPRCNYAATPDQSCHRRKRMRIMFLMWRPRHLTV